VIFLKEKNKEKEYIAGTNKNIIKENSKIISCKVKVSCA
jgi:hypothetical protein